MNIRLVSGLDEALEHIRTYFLDIGWNLFCAEDRLVSERFLREVDSACVYHNASTCFSDGAEFGLGAEIGISTQKLHAVDHFALEALTSTKWIIREVGRLEIKEKTGWMIHPSCFRTLLEKFKGNGKVECIV